MIKQTTQFCFWLCLTRSGNFFCMFLIRYEYYAKFEYSYCAKLTISSFYFSIHLFPTKQLQWQKKVSFSSLFFCLKCRLGCTIRIMNETTTQNIAQTIYHLMQNRRWLTTKIAFLKQSKRASERNHSVRMITTGLKCGSEQQTKRKRTESVALQIIWFITSRAMSVECNLPPSPSP